VEAGDEIRLLHRDPQGLCVRRVSDLLYTAACVEPSLHAALDIPARAEGWRWSFRGLRAVGDGLGNPGLVVPPADRPHNDGLRDFTVTRAAREFVDHDQMNPTTVDREGSDPRCARGALVLGPTVRLQQPQCLLAECPEHALGAASTPALDGLVLGRVSEERPGPGVRPCTPIRAPSVRGPVRIG
jgi:hypothetical protein